MKPRTKPETANRTRPSAQNGEAPRVVDAARSARAHGRPAAARGFTLTELMITVSLLAVLLVATAASLGIFSPRASRQDLHDATAEVLDQVEFARMRAAMTNHAVEFRVTRNGDVQSLELWDHPSNNCLQTLNATRLRALPFGSTAVGPRGWSGGEDGMPVFTEVAVTATIPSSLETAGLCFRPDGRVTEQDGTLFDAPPGTNLAAGEALISLRMRVEQDSPAAIQHDVVVPYNGLAKVRYIVP